MPRSPLPVNWHNSPAAASRAASFSGGGSNLVLSGDFDGLLLHMAIGGRQLVAEDDDAWYVRAGAGENWHQLVTLDTRARLAGTRKSGIDSRHGRRSADPEHRCLRARNRRSLPVARSLRHAKRQDAALDRAACRFAYRDSVFKQQGWHLDAARVVTHVTLRLPKAWQPLTGYADLAAELDQQQIANPNARQIAAAVIDVRRRKLPDPAVLPNAGSFFHNPLVDTATGERLASRFPGLPRYPQVDGRVKLAAGWLIEQSGWKGRNLGRVGMYEKQALVLVNRGGASGAEVIALAKAVQAAVRERFGVELTPEPVFL
jgi:UDP-N-acetylmuramate dehydrogenase